MDDLFLPDVVYCDVQQISNALGVLVSDLATEYRMRTVESKGHESSFEAGLEHPLAKVVARYVSDQSGIVEKEALISRPPAALLADLHNILEHQGRIQRLIGFDRGIWEQLRVGEFVEIDGRVEVMPIAILFDAFIRWGRQLSGAVPGIEKQKILLAESFLPKIPVLLWPHVEDKELKFVTLLKRDDECLPGGTESLVGDFTLFGRIRKIVSKGHKETFGLVLPGNLRLTKEKLEELLAGLRKLRSSGLDLGFDPDTVDLELVGPWIELNTLAIYQLA